MEREDLDENQLAQLSDWENAFRGLLGSKSDEVCAWALHLCLWNPFVEREESRYHVAWAIFAKLLRDKVDGPTGRRIIREIHTAIDDGKPLSPLMVETFDWEAAKERVEAYLKQWGTSL